MIDQPCECPGPGECPRYGKFVGTAAHRLCRDRPEYRKVLAAPPEEAHEPLRLLSPDDVPCVHRLSFLRKDRCRLLACVGGPEVDVLRCATQGECTINQHAIPGVAVCRGCDSRSEVARAPIAAPSIAVIVICHNYARFLRECVASVRANTAPAAELLVVDDSSTDDTAAVCEQLGVQRLRVEFGNVVPSRGAGLGATHAKYVCFLDADDQLGDTYLSDAARILDADPDVAIVYTDMTTFGADSGVMTLPRDPSTADIRRENFIHAGAVVRRAALESVDRLREPKLPLSLEDWELWRAILRDGWRAAKSPATYRYRKHEGSMSWRIVQREATYFDLYAMSREEVTIVLPLSGRWQWRGRLTRWSERQTWPHVRMLVIDSSGDEHFGQVVRDYLTISPARSTSYHRVDAGEPGVADADRHQPRVYNAVRRAMPRIYNRVRDELRTEFALIVEDDILPPLDAIERLLRSMGPDVAAVSGAYRSRFQPAFVAWRKPDLVTITEAGTGVEPVAGTGFGCVLVRKSAMERHVFHAAEGSNFDPNFGAAMHSAGLRILLDWSVRCRHGDLE